MNLVSKLSYGLLVMASELPGTVVKNQCLRALSLLYTGQTCCAEF